MLAFTRPNQTYTPLLLPATKVIHQSPLPVVNFHTPVPDKPQKLTLKNWPEDDQPRLKLLRKGAHSLSDSELLSILIGTGTREQNAIDIGRQVLGQYQNSLLALGKCSLSQLIKIKGIGTAKAVAIMAALEISRRKASALPPERLEINNSREAAGYLRPLLIDYTREVFAVLYLNQGGIILQYEVISEGGITSTTVDPRLIFRKAIELQAVSIIACHNHPSGSLKPSTSDQALTKQLLEGASYLGIHLLDHLIVSEKGYYSFADDGQLNCSTQVSTASVVPPNDNPTLLKVKPPYQ
jgi:DNA repair protein RadC